MDAITRLIWIGFVVTVFFYGYWWNENRYIFGMSDVDNYLRMGKEFEILQGFDLRHGLMRSIIGLIPTEALIMLLPAIYWFGIAYPTYLMFGKDNVFILVFGTASLPLMFILGLWSQNLSISFLLWGIFCMRECRFKASIVLIGCSLLYFPTAYAIVAGIHFGSFLALSVLVYALFPYVFTFADWSAWWPFVLYVCPLVWIRLFMRKDVKDKDRGIFMIMALSRLSRGLIYMFPFLGFSLPWREKAAVLIWWILVVVVFLLNYRAEMQCFYIFECRNLYGIM